LAEISLRPFICIEVAKLLEKSEKTKGKSDKTFFSLKKVRFTGKNL